MSIPRRLRVERLTFLLLTCFSLNVAVRRVRPLLSGAHSLVNSNASSSPDENYVVKLNNNGNIEYWGDFTFGRQTLPAIYDTGSFEVLTLSTLCESCPRDGPVYDRKASKSFKSGDAIEAVHQFGSGPVSSRKAEETLRIGDRESPLVAKSMPFWEVISHGIDVWHTSKFVAIVGLGQKDTVPVDPAMQKQMAKSMEEDGLEKKEIKKRMEPEETLLHRLGVSEFSICLGRGNFAPGSLSFGPKLASMKAQALFSPIPVVGKVHWGVKMTKLGPGKFDPCDPSCGVVIDSGTSFMSLSPKAIHALSEIGEQINEDCSNLDDLPDLTFNLGDHPFSLPPAAYVIELEFGEAKQINVNLLAEFVQKKIVSLRARGMARACVPAVQEIDHMTQYGPMMILGMPFLRHYYTIFDRGEKKIYAAPSSESCSLLKKGEGKTEKEKEKGEGKKEKEEKEEGDGETKGDSFALETEPQERARAPMRRHQRSKLDVQPTHVDLSEVRMESGLLRPGMPYWIDL